MAKINYTISKYKEKFKDYKMLFMEDRFLDNGEKFKEFINIFDNVIDSRIKLKCIYSTKFIVVITFLAFLDIRESWQEIADFAEDKRWFLEQFIEYPDTLPVHDTYMRVFSKINSETLENSIIEFLTDAIDLVVNQNVAKDDDALDILAIDGKALKGSGRLYNTENKVPNNQIMHFWDVSNQLCVKSVVINEKTNEIPTAQQILPTLDIKNKIVTADAMNCQKETVKIIRDGKAHYVLAIKGNHMSLINQLMFYCLATYYFMAGWLRTFFCFTMNKSEIKKILMNMCADEINLVYELIRTEYKHVSTDKNANHKIINRESYKCCNKCSSTHLVKNGKTKTGVQKFICVDCHKSQSSTTNTVLFSTKRSYVDWVLFLKCELKEYTLREIANEIGISLRTAFYWRHKLYKSIEKYVNSINVSGNIQIDSTYEKINLKGTKPKNMPRPSKKRGNDSDGKRGISRLKVCVVTAVDDYDNIVMKIAGVGRETIENYNIIKPQIKNPKLMITDQAWGFTSFAKECGCQLNQIPFGAYVTDKGNNMNTWAS